MPLLDKYTGEWNLVSAKHLLHRTMLGPSIQIINNAINLGLDATINSLLNLHPIDEFPIKYIVDGPDGIDDPDVNYNQSWIDAPIVPNLSDEEKIQKILDYRKSSLHAWTIKNILHSDMSITGKLWLFWHNHFVVANIDNPTRAYQYARLLFDNSLNDIKELTYAITIDTSMLIYLSGATNSKTAPNENYARELLELFTLGKGQLSGPGDYTTYTELDVTEGAKILTGWKVKSDDQPSPLVSIFDANDHSLGTKTLSHRFNNKVIQESGSNEYKDYIDTIFERNECALFLTRKFFKYFIKPEIVEIEEEEIIAPLADILFEDQYNPKRMLSVLFSSEYFYAEVKCKVKSPLELLADATIGLGFSTTLNEPEYYFNYASLYHIAKDLNQNIYHHPNVAGWPAYYQTPQLDKLWVNNILLPRRKKLLRTIIAGGEIMVDNNPVDIDPLFSLIDFIKGFAEAEYIESLIIKIAELIFIYPISSNQITLIKSRVMQGIPDFEWTIEYQSHINNPNDLDIQDSINKKLIIMFNTFFTMPEFQIS